MHENEIVTTIWGKMTRREMLRGLVAAGLTAGAAGMGIGQSSAQTSGDILSPSRELSGTPFRDITNFQSFEDEPLDSKRLQVNGVPKARQRDTSWFDKPSNSIGVSLLQFTNSPASPLNSCAQAACATLLNFHKKAPAGLSGDGITNEVLRTHPPNGGERGTSFYFAEKILSAYGLKTWAGISNDMSEQELVTKLKTWVSQGTPCVVLVDLGIAQKRPSQETLGHFAVVFAYTDTHVFLTNWNYKKTGGWANDWPTFMKAWNLPNSKLHNPLLTGWA